MIQCNHRGSLKFFCLSALVCFMIRPAAFSFYNVMGNDDFCCQKAGTFKMAQHLSRSGNAKLEGININGSQMRRGQSGQNGVVK